MKEKENAVNNQRNPKNIQYTVGYISALSLSFMTAITIE
jgi:hypothetical protein